MAVISWNATGEKFYETGTKNGVLYPKDASGQYGTGVPWNGLTAVTENPSGAEESKLYADDQKYLSLYSAEDFGCTIEAYTYPPEFAVCDGSAEIAPGVMAGQQSRRGFGFSYRTVVGNDQQGEAYGYKLHLIYGATASPSEKSYATINDSPDAVTFSWEVTTTPENVPGHKPTAIITIDSAKVLQETKGEERLQTLLDALYGTASEEPRLPLPSEVISIMTAV